jgi:NAD(P)H-hydrate epimerase
VQADRFAAARALSRRSTAVLKGRHSLVAWNGEVYVNPTGAPTLATAGSGDVLTGVIGGLLARGTGALDAARTGVWMHGRAGEALADTRAEGWIADDVAAAIPRAFPE